MRGTGRSVLILFAAAGAVTALTASAGSIALLGAVIGATAESPPPRAAVQGAPLNSPVSPIAVSPLPTAALPVDDSAPVTFDLLAGFQYDDKGTEEERAEAIPPEVADLDGQVVTVRGYMVPVTLDGAGGVRTFLLTENQLLCCYGIMPSLNEWIAVEMRGERGAALHADRPITVTGMLSVGETSDTEGAVSLYRMTGERVARVAGRGLRDLGGI